MEAMQSSLSKGGGLYKGYIAQICRDLPFRVLQMTSYENLKSWYRNLVISKEFPRELSPLENLLVGAVAGSISSFFTTPLDVLKT